MYVFIYWVRATHAMHRGTSICVVPSSLVTIAKVLRYGRYNSYKETTPSCACTLQAYNAKTAKDLRLARKPPNLSSSGPKQQPPPSD